MGVSGIKCVYQAVLTMHMGGGETGADLPFPISQYFMLLVDLDSEAYKRGRDCITRCG